MAVLVGRHVMRIDRKGRVSVPKPFRDVYQSKGGFPGIYAYPSPKETAIEACHEERMQEIAESVDDLDMFSEKQKDFAMVVLASAHQLSYDPEGRIVLPPDLMAHAGLDGEAMFVGCGATFQIWKPQAFEPIYVKAVKRVKDGDATLSLRRRAAVPQ
jgi:MraZ protein